jgi:hypothetical protein
LNITYRKPPSTSITAVETQNPTPHRNLLQDIAYWLVRNGESDAEIDRVLDRINARLDFLPEVNSDAETVLRHLLERSGLLREAIANRVDFVHRTFQEYLAAKAAIDADDIGALVNSAHLDQWHEVIVMAAGHATRRQRDRLLKGLLKQRLTLRRRRDYLDLLAVSCLETSAEVEPKLYAEIKGWAARPIPPRSRQKAMNLVSAGEAVLDLLASSNPKTEKDAVRVIRAAAWIGGDSALQFLAVSPPEVSDLRQGRRRPAGWRHPAGPTPSLATTATAVKSAPLIGGRARRRT